MQLVAIVKEAWGWIGIDPLEIVGDNDFGNLMVKDKGGRYWRLCPEDLECKVVASDRAELDALSQDQEFLHDWHMTALVEQARERLGPLRPGYKYYLIVPGALGGEYGGSNLASIPLSELIAASGSIARQIAGLPDGTQVQLSVVD
jgi:hypothetical protein